MTFKKQLMDSEELVDIFADGKDDKEKCIELVKGYFTEIHKVFDRLRELSPLEVIRDDRQKQNFVIDVYADVILTSTS